MRKEPLMNSSTVKQFYHVMQLSHWWVNTAKNGHLSNEMEPSIMEGASILSMLNVARTHTFVQHFLLVYL